MKTLLRCRALVVWGYIRMCLNVYAPEPFHTSLTPNIIRPVNACVVYHENLDVAPVIVSLFVGLGTRGLSPTSVQSLHDPTRGSIHTVSCPILLEKDARGALRKFLQRAASATAPIAQSGRSRSSSRELCVPCSRQNDAVCAEPLRFPY